MLCPENLSLLPDSLETTRGPGITVGVRSKFLLSTTAWMSSPKRESGPHRSPRSQRYNRARDGKGCFLDLEAGREGQRPNLGHGCSQRTCLGQPCHP